MNSSHNLPQFGVRLLGSRFYYSTHHSLRFSFLECQFQCSACRNSSRFWKFLCYGYLYSSFSGSLCDLSRNQGEGRVWVGGFFLLQSSLVSPSQLMYLSILSILTDSKRQSINGEFSSSLRDSDWKMFYFCLEPWTLCTYFRLMLLST